MQSRPCGRKPSCRHASFTCCATASAMPRGRTGRRSPRTSSPSIPRRARHRAGPAEFAGKWEKRYPAIIGLWTNAWAEFVPFLQFDNEIRTVICTTNAIESINARIRRAVNARGHFPTEQAALKCIYLAILSLDPTGKGRKRWSNRWKAALNAFEITFDGRLSAGRN
jgi:transposase-like protein